MVRTSPNPGHSEVVSHSSREFGHLGEVGRIAYGCWRFADIYGYDGTAPAPGAGFGIAEELLGRVLADAPHLRDRIVLATKGGITPPVPYDSGADHLRDACDGSLRRLGVEVIDLYQIHRPDLLTHPAEVAGTLDDLVRRGKVRALGISNHTVGQARALVAHRK